MVDLAGWLALAATSIAAVMTAANLGPRVTGWGFVIFTVGAAAWIAIGLATHQSQLLYSNCFLAVVDLIGIWRWLGSRARISDAAAGEVRRSHEPAVETLFSAARLDNLPVYSPAGNVIARAVDALITCRGGSIAYFIVRTGGVGGVGEALRRLPWDEANVADTGIRTRLDDAAIQRLPEAEPDSATAQTD
ncbi:PRC-barrel domain containing protein [Sphingomonas panacisoli]|uniref:PRC-barrel domain containing protein n=1 Tax=Sphingomonas panacisoli TaxID=1813879 RepID=A0A5B8LG87_9SPHN|nr:PRC-barrel domain-containing protein [Sphingomonas panacisoli]QDZ06785.1 PRC-barrel domain containing protein [Sphingomonas panacisoli]